MGMDFRRRGTVVGALGLVTCSAISGIFLGVVAALCGYLGGGGHAVGVGAFVACGAFAVNALVICVTVVAAEGRVQRRSRRAMHDGLELARGTRSCLTTAESAIGLRAKARGARSAVASIASEPGTVLDAEELANSMQRS
jgi:hypothetical protein